MSTPKVKKPRGPHLKKVLNRLVQGCSRMVVGPLPVYLSADDTLNNQCLEYNIAGFIWSGITAGFSTNNFMGYINHVPNSMVNDNQDFTVEIIVDSTLDNYMLLRRWVELYKTTEHRLDSNSGPNEEEIWDAQRAWCDFIDVWVVDNMNWPIAIIRYKEVFCYDLGGITMNFNSDAELKATASFKYNRVEYIRKPSDIDQIIHSTTLT